MLVCYESSATRCDGACQRGSRKRGERHPLEDHIILEGLIGGHQALLGILQAYPLTTIAQCRWDEQLSLPSGLHGLNSLLQTRDHLINTSRIKELLSINVVGSRAPLYASMYLIRTEAKGEVLLALHVEGVKGLPIAQKPAIRPFMK